MFNLDLVKITAFPFEHIVKDDFIEPLLYSELCKNFPPLELLNLPLGQQKEYSIIWEDQIFQDLIKRCRAWKIFFEHIQTQVFTDYWLKQFGAVGVAHGCQLDFEKIKFVRYCEPSSEKGQRELHHPEQAFDNLYVQPHIFQGGIGYFHTKHLDRRRRFVTILIYFCDSELDKRIGGDLTLLGPLTDENSVKIAPQHNRMVAFACTNQSYHCVSEILAQTSPRNFITIFISSFFNIWPIEKYQYSERCLTIINVDSHFEFDGQYYQVPNKYLNCEVTVCSTDTVIQCFYQDHCIASHPREHDKKSS